jgi:hypothetical protein
MPILFEPDDEFKTNFRETVMEDILKALATGEIVSIYVSIVRKDGSAGYAHGRMKEVPLPLVLGANRVNELAFERQEMSRVPHARSSEDDPIMKLLAQMLSGAHEGEGGEGEGEGDDDGEGDEQALEAAKDHATS